MLDPRRQVQDTKSVSYMLERLQGVTERDVWAFLRWDFKHVKANDLMMEQATEAFHSYYSRGFIEPGFSARCLACRKSRAMGSSCRGSIVGRNQQSRNQAPHSESWRTQVNYAGRRGANTQALRPKQTGYRVFIDRQ